MVEVDLVSLNKILPVPIERQRFTKLVVKLLWTQLICFIIH